ncbi:MOSC domain-containing protein [Deinococcus alpinitundrae]|uniref:MOSC domain-containing protein n=1 Tax=Deinococcus alpinitundrae TaxID=468913 RepID=UPI00137B78F2|nr:MOSC N-terminal beta barrel domain-containing protein [Deinococcus alpinitundrae]
MIPTPLDRLTLSALYIYPIKSAGGVSLPASDLGPTGLTHDRRWMVVDAAGRPVTQREQPRLKVVEVTLGMDSLQVNAPQMPALQVPFAPQGEARAVDMWGQPLRGVCVEAAANWFSTFLDGDFGLVWMPADVERFQPDGRPYRSQISFVDGNPFHLITEASLADIDAQVSREVGAAEMRPNLVISGGRAYQEDFWRRIRVGEVAFEVVESCARCAVINVTASGERSAEPLRTLARTRLRNQAVPFGQHLVQDAPPAQRFGHLRVGDVLEVLEVGSTPTPMYE